MAVIMCVGMVVGMVVVVMVVAKGRQTKETLAEDRKSTRLNSSHANISYAVFCLKKNETQGAAAVVRRSLHRPAWLLSSSAPGRLRTDPPRLLPLSGQKVGRAHV